MTPLNLLSLSLLLLSFHFIFGANEAQEYDQHKPELESTREDGKKREVNVGMKLDDSINSPATTLHSSTTPLTNPSNLPQFTPTPTIVTVPASNPTSVIPLNPPLTTVPTPTSPTTPMPMATPLSNPPPSVPTTTTTTNAPISPGQTWCLARTGASESSLQAALDYACGIGGADCSMIQIGASCYNPNSVENHASYAFNSYFQRNPVPSSCDFGGTAMLVNTNPSSGYCIYPSSATPAAMPLSTDPPATTTSTTGATGSSPGVSGSGSYVPPPSVLNTSFPASGAPTTDPPTGNSVPAGSAALQPVIGFVVLIVSFSTGKLIMSTKNFDFQRRR